MKYVNIITFSFAYYHKVFGEHQCSHLFSEESPGEFNLRDLGRRFHIRAPVLANDFFICSVRDYST